MSLTDASVKLMTPVDDVLGQGYAMVPEMLVDVDSDPIAKLVKELAFPFAHEPREVIIVPFFTQENIPVSEIGDRPHSFIFHEGGFFQLIVSRTAAHHIFRDQLRGKKVNHPDSSEFAMGNVASRLVHMFAKALEKNDLLSVFDGETSEIDYFVPAFTCYRPFSDVFEGDRLISPHRDNLEDAVVLSFQLEPDVTAWRIYRYKYDIPRNRNIANAVQSKNGLLILDSHELVGARSNPFHNPVVGKEGRVSVQIICVGKFRDRVLERMRELDIAQSYETQLQPEFEVSLGSHFGRSLNRTNVKPA